jgi:plasmid stabilization system protein ParE
MTSVIWTPAALGDLTRLRAFLAAKNREAARSAIRAICQGVGVLRTHPELGRAIDEMPPEFRERFVPFGSNGHVVVYALRTF